MNIEDLLENSGIEQKPPPSHASQSLIRNLTCIIRWPVRIAILPFIWLDCIAQKIARLIIPPPFVKAGKCKKRGNCCHYILARKIKGPFGALDLFWHTQINGFFRREKKPIAYENGLVYVMGCRYLNKNGSCRRYFFRPAICRSWPRIEIFGTPEVLKGCGIYPKKRTSHPLNILKD